MLKKVQALKEEDGFLSSGYLQCQSDWFLSLAGGWQMITCFQWIWWKGAGIHPVQAAERIGGGRANTKSAARNKDSVRGVGVCPKKILRFYMLWSVFWELVRLFMYTYKMPSSIGGFRLKSMTYGALASGLRSSLVR